LTLRLNVSVIWPAFIFMVVLTAGIAYSLRMVPKTMLTGEELIALRDAQRTVEARSGESI
jgi:hypothetical protein